MFIEWDGILLLYCIALTKGQGEGQTLDLCVTHIKNIYVNADYGWAISMLCCHEFCICIQIKFQLLSNSTPPYFHSFERWVTGAGIFRVFPYTHAQRWIDMLAVENSWKMQAKTEKTEDSRKYWIL